MLHQCAVCLGNRHGASTCPSRYLRPAGSGDEKGKEKQKGKRGERQPQEAKQAVAGEQAATIKPSSVEPLIEPTTTLIGYGLRCKSPKSSRQPASFALSVHGSIPKVSNINSVTSCLKGIKRISPLAAGTRRSLYLFTVPGARKHSATVHLHPAVGHRRANGRIQPRNRQ